MVMMRRDTTGMVVLFANDRRAPPSSVRGRAPACWLERQCLSIMAGHSTAGPLLFRRSSQPARVPSGRHQCGCGLPSSSLCACLAAAGAPTAGARSPQCTPVPRVCRVFAALWRSRNGSTTAAAASVAAIGRHAAAGMPVTARCTTTTHCPAPAAAAGCGGDDAVPASTPTSSPFFPAVATGLSGPATFHPCLQRMRSASSFACADYLCVVDVDRDPRRAASSVGCRWCGASSQLCVAGGGCFPSRCCRERLCYDVQPSAARCSWALRRCAVSRVTQLAHTLPLPSALSTRTTRSRRRCTAAAVTPTTATIRCAPRVVDFPTLNC